MRLKSHIFESPIGKIFVEIEGNYVIGMRPYREGDKFTDGNDSVIIEKLEKWLKCYFGGQTISEIPPVSFSDTPFRKKVWKKLLEIPYGKVVTYKQLASWLGTSPRAIGQAVGHNPIFIIVPCHRVIGTDGSLTGYAYGLEMKRKLLEIEHISM